MKAEVDYGQFCPVAMAAEVLCTRWTMLVVRELICGSKRFNDLRRGVPRMSPALLSRRLKELEQAGIIRRVASPKETGLFEYHLTRSGRDLQAVVEAMGLWGHHWVETSAVLQKLDPGLLMWDMRRRIDPAPMPRRRCVIQFLYSDLPAARRGHWLIVTPGEEVEVCSVDPGFETDLYVATDVRTMTSVWMGLMPFAGALRDKKIVLTGDKALAGTMQKWLNFSAFATEKKLARA